MDDPKIVTRPARVDFHIHSAASVRTRDAGNEALARCTPDRVETLVEKMSDPKLAINMCAITDHDCFDVEMYRALKSKEGHGSLEKVLPGVEFTVALPDDMDRPTPIHVVAIFDDRGPDDLIEALDSHIPKTAEGRPEYDCEDKSAFSSQRFSHILSDIGLNAVLVGHEKSVGREQRNDVSSLGAERADEIVLTEFIDAVEIRNRHHEVDMRNLVERYTKPDVPFVLGSDCHDWDAYPLSSAGFCGREDEVGFCSLKCLPTFEGLVMSITDPSRIKVGNASFFNPATPKLDSLDLVIDGEPCSIPMSAGVNVIIGDNSIGKSMILHVLTDLYGDGEDARRLKEGYREYCRREKIEVKSRISPSQLFWFDDQGSIRGALEELHEGTEGSRFDRYFQEHVNLDVVKGALKRHLESCVDALASKVEYNDFMGRLKEMIIPLEVHEVSDRMAVAGSLRAKQTKDVEGFNGAVESVRDQVAAIKTNHRAVLSKLGPDAEKNLDDAVEALNRLLALGQGEMASRKFDNEKRGVVRRIANELKGRLQQAKTDEENSRDAYKEQLDAAAAQVARAVALRLRRKAQPMNPEGVNVRIGRTPVGDLEFVSELNIKQIDRNYCVSLLEGIFNKTPLPIIVRGIEGETDLTSEKVASSFSANKPPSEKWAQEMKRQLDAAVDLISERGKITNEKIGLDSEPSAGLYGRIYFDLMAGDEKQGIYLVDQPEDQISQTAIRNDVIRAFSKMRQKRQVIIVTHNPQFVVNLDADNVIALGRDEEGKISVRSGALEYGCEDYSILGIVADTVEGGADVVRRRLKRYGAQDTSRRPQQREDLI